MLELLEKDLAGRIARFKTTHGTIETPTILPVINPNRQTVPASEMREFGAQALITNSYIIWKGEEIRETAMKKGVHSLLGWDGPIMTDSGAFQLMVYGDIDVDNEEIIRFQDTIGVDIGVMLDIPGLADHATTAKNIATTVERAKEAKRVIASLREAGSKALWSGPVQGGEHIDLREQSAREMAALDFDVYPLGTVVPLLNKYEFATHVDIISRTKAILPLDKPVHLFGAGHPIFFAFAVALGIDMFDSAAYSLFAQKGKYLTVNGTKSVAELVELPCSCPICSEHTAKEIAASEALLARHNLYATFEEIDTVKAAIRDGTLWELCEMRARAHPAMYAAFRRFATAGDYLESLDTYTKKHFFVLSEETKNRPEVVRHKRIAADGFSTECVDLPLFGPVPRAVLDMYPFGQMVHDADEMQMPASGCTPLEVVNGIAEYQFGVKKLFSSKDHVELSRSTGRIRMVKSADGEILATLRPSDYVMVPHGIGAKIAKATKKWRVVVAADAVPFAREGRNVFAKFVVDVDPDIRAGMEVLVFDEAGALLGHGKAIMAAREMREFKRGVAIDMRNGEAAPAE